MTFKDSIQLLSAGTTIGEWGTFEADEPITARCNIIEELNTVLDVTGKQVVSNIKIYFPIGTPINIHSKIKIDDIEYDVKNFANKKDTRNVARFIVVYL